MHHHVIIFIHNMCCAASIGFVELLLPHLQIAFTEVVKGKAMLVCKLTANQRVVLFNALKERKLKLLSEQEAVDYLNEIEMYKEQVRRFARTADGAFKVKLSQRFAGIRKFQNSYKKFSAFFSYAVGCSLERFFNREQVKYVLELLIEKKKTISDIVIAMQYCDASHLYKQFKRVTGINFADFKKNIDKGGSYKLGDDCTIIFS